MARSLLATTALAIPLSTTVEQAGVLGLLALSAVGLAAGWPIHRRTPLDGVLLLFYGTLLLSTLASGHPLEASGWRYAWIVVTYLVVVRWVEDDAHVVRLARLVVIAGTIAGAYGVLQHFTGADWYRAALGRPLRVAPRVPGDARFAVPGFFRSYLTFAHVMIVPFAWAAARAAQGRLAAAVAAGVVLTAIVFSSARGAWLAAAAVVGALAVVGDTGRGRALLAALVLVGGLALGTNPDLRRQAREMFALGGANVGRVAIYETNLAIIHDHSWLGLGYGRYRTAAVPYYARRPEADRRSHAHNNYLQVAAEAGLLGLGAFVLLFVTVLVRGLAVIRSQQAPDVHAAAVGAWCAIVGFSVGGLTQYTFGDNEVALAMWFAAALLMRLGSV